MAKAPLLALGPSLFLGGALFNVLPSPTDPLYFVMTNWLSSNMLPAWERWAIQVSSYYLLPALWYMFLFLVFYLYGGELEERVTVTGVVFALGMVVFVVWDLGFNGAAIFGNTIPNAATVAGIAGTIVAIFTLLIALVTKQLFEIFEW